MKTSHVDDNNHRAAPLDHTWVLPWQAWHETGALHQIQTCSWFVGLKRLPGSLQAAFTYRMQVRTIHRWKDPSVNRLSSDDVSAFTLVHIVKIQLYTEWKAKTKPRRCAESLQCRQEVFCFLIGFRSQMSGVSIQEEELVSKCFQVLMDSNSSRGLFFLISFSH